MRVAGDFDAGVQDQDGALLLANIADVRAMGAAASDMGLRLRYANAMQAPAMSQALRRLLPANLQIIDWTVDNASYFRAIRIEKTMMSLILLLIVAVAAFNIVAMLVMTVTDKRNDIAILRTLGRLTAHGDGGLHDPGTGHRLGGSRDGRPAGSAADDQHEPCRALPGAHTRISSL